MTEIEKIASAMKNSFLASVSESAGKPFSETGVSVPSDDIWLRYASAALGAIDPAPSTHVTLDDNSPRYSTRRMRDELEKAKEFARSQALEENAAVVQAGKHLAVKLAEVYRAAGQKPADCQAIRDWMTSIKDKTPQPRALGHD